MTRRELLRGTAAVAGSCVASRLAAGTASAAGATDSVMKPFRIAFPKDKIADVHRRIDATNWPEMPFDAGWSAGVNDRVLRDLVRYWRREYDWFKVQDTLNTWTHLRGPVGGEQMHCAVQRAATPNARLPIVLLYAWPDTFMEFSRVAPLLAKGDGTRGFDVVVPSYPGFPFSDAPHGPGMNITRVAERIHLMMRELGYERYGVQGGGWGAFIATELAARYPSAVAGLHLHWTGGDRPAPASLPISPQPRTIDRAAGRNFYVEVHATTPHSLAYGVQDSPVGWLAWILPRYWLMSDAGDNFWSTWDRSHVITTAMVYWLTGRILSAFRLYWETDGGLYAPPHPITVPTGYARFAGSPTRESIAARYPNIVHYSEPPRGGWRYAFMEEPELFAKDLTAFFAKV